MESLEVRQVRMLREIATRGSFSAAAEALNYTQSAVSKQLATLERDAGLALVERGVRPVRLTAGGEALLAHADAIVGHLAAARDELAAIVGLRAGSLRVAAFASAGATVIVPALVAFHAHYPNVKLSLIEADPNESLSRLRAGELDIAVIYEYPTPSSPLEEHAAATHLLDDHFGLILPADHRLATKRQVEIADLSGERWLFPRSLGALSSTYDRLMRAACAAADFEPNILFEINDCQTAQGFVAAGMGIAVLPHLALHPLHAGVVVRELPQAPMRRVLAIHSATGPLSPPITPALDLLINAARSIEG